MFRMGIEILILSFNCFKFSVDKLLPPLDMLLSSLAYPSSPSLLPIKTTSVQNKNN